MPGAINTLMIDGSFEELADELAHHIDGLIKKEGGTSNIQSELAPLLEKQGQQQEILKKLVSNSAALNGAPEKGRLSISPALEAEILTLLGRIHSRLQPPYSLDQTGTRGRVSRSMPQ